MSLQLIIGSSGSGKSYRLYQDIIKESMAHPEQNFLILVPEQFTMQTQKELVSLHPVHGIMNIDVLSFQRLAYHVLDEVGGGHRTVLEDTGKNLVIRRLSQQNKDRLKVLGSKLDRMGYVSEMKSILSELAQYNVDGGMLEKAAGQVYGNRMLQDKLHDIGILQEEFRKYREGSYITSEEVLEELCKAAEYSHKLKDSVIALDGFTGFTPIQYLLLEKLMKCAGKLMITVTMDPAEYPFTAIHEEELFALSKQTIWELRRIADDTGVREEAPVILEGSNPRLDGSKELVFLEKHLLRYDDVIYIGEIKDIHLLRAADPQQEVLRTVFLIQKLVKEEGYRYRDIAVITGDMERYCNYVQRHFSDSRIPCFIDYKRDILSNPFIEFLRSVFQMMEENFSYDSVFRYLRSGLTGISVDAVDRMDNYCTAMGIRGYKKYEEPWTRLYQGQEPEELEILNDARAQFVEQVRDFRKNYAGNKISVRKRTVGLYDWCVRLSIQQKLKQYELWFTQKTELALAREYAQVYRIVMDLLDKIVELMGDEIIPLKEYARILDAGLEEAKVGIIPPGNDQVLVGDMERTRLKDIKALFFLGVNDGVIPSAKEASGILSQLDRRYLKAFHLPLAPDGKENAWIQQFYLYLNLTRPSEKLYISCSARNSAGEVLRPSYLIGVLQELFPGLQLQIMNSRISYTEAGSSRQAYLRLAEEIGEGNLSGKDTLDIGRCFLDERRDNKDVKVLLEAAGEQKMNTYLDQAVAHALYGKELTGSVTRLEKYAACAYAHFLSYGLRIRERQEYTFAALDLGNILHKAMELYTAELKKNSYTWFDIPEKIQQELMDRCVLQVAEEYGNTILLSSARNTYMISRMKQMGRRTVWAVTEQVRKGQFVPQGFEVAFSAADHLNSVSYRLSDGTKLKLTGRIDRTDIYENETDVYVKVIDYKSGAQSFVPGDVYYGLSLQLVVYMNAAMEMETRTHKEKRVIPAAMLYYQMKDPILDAEAFVTEEMLKTERMKELCTKGLVNSDPDVIRLLDDEMGNGIPVIPASMTKSGTLSARSSAATARQMELLSEHVKDKIAEFGEGIISGDITAHPYQKAGKTACDYCKYQMICGFDKRLPGCEYKRLMPLSSWQVWERLENDERGVQKNGSEMDG